MLLTQPDVDYSTKGCEKSQERVFGVPKIVHLEAHTQSSRFLTLSRQEWRERGEWLTETYKTLKFKQGEAMSVFCTARSQARNEKRDQRKQFFRVYYRDRYR